MKPPVILFKFATRSRPERFFKSLDSIVDNLYDKENYKIIVAADFDDETMNTVPVINRLLTYKNLSVAWGTSESKIHAINRDIPKEGFDILCVHSDDMVWTFYGFDQIIRQEFLDGDFDKLVHVPDSDAKNMLATYYIAGKDFYHRFDHVYHPSYKSLFADNEVQDIAQSLGKYRFVDCTGMLFHEHPSYGHIAFDAQYNSQQALWATDEENYLQRRSRNFEL
jgi:hypothetical protein